MHRRDKKLSFVAQTPTPVRVTRGQKRYELSNHLGNVHTVLSDRKKTECSGNTFSAYEPEIINTYDYYPFGMLMEERKGQKPECTTSSSATTKTPYNYTFTWLTHDFIMYGTNVTVGSSGSALTVDRNSSLVASNWGTQKSGHSLVKGVTYTLSYQLQGAAPSGYTSTIGRTVQVRLKWGTSVMASGTLTLTSAMQSGSFNYTADYTGDYTIEIIYTGAGLNKGLFLADNVKITYNSQLTTVNCGVAEKYLYGFNGKEKIDEQYGIEGTSYDYGFRVYDSRIAKFLSVDPLTASFAYYTPYQFAGNKPIIAIDIDGLEEYYVIRWVDQDGAHQSSALTLKVAGQHSGSTPIDLRLPGHQGEEAYIVEKQIGTNTIIRSNFGTLNETEKSAVLQKTNSSQNSPNSKPQGLTVGAASGNPVDYEDWSNWEGTIQMQHKTESQSGKRPIVGASESIQSSTIKLWDSNVLSGSLKKELTEKAKHLKGAIELSLNQSVFYTLGSGMFGREIVTGGSDPETGIPNANNKLTMFEAAQKQLRIVGEFLKKETGAKVNIGTTQVTSDLSQGKITIKVTK